MAEARRRGVEAVVLTFDPHPAKVLAPERAPPLIQAQEDKLQLLGRAGVDAVALRTAMERGAMMPVGISLWRKMRLVRLTVIGKSC